MEDYEVIESDEKFCTHFEVHLIRQLDGRLRPLVDQSFKLRIKNPQNIYTEETTLWPNNPKYFVDYRFEFPPEPTLGLWFAEIWYGPDKYILQSLDDISGLVAVNYTYGKAVTGTVEFKYGVKDPKDNRIHYFGSTSAKQLRNGFAEYTLSTNKLRQTPFAWFPTVVGHRLVVEVSVHETVTERKERTIDDSVVFVTTPYVISFKDTFTDFKPNVTTFINAQINNVLGEGVPNLAAIRTHILWADKAPHEFVYIANKSINSTTLSVDDIYHSQIVVNGGTISNVFHFVVLNRGNIIHTQIISDNKLRIEITREMTPYIRLMVLGFANDGKQLLSDSIKIYVNEEKCAFDVRFDNDMVDAKPGQQLDLLISGSIDDSIGLLAIDEAVYHLRDKDKLTRSKLYNELSKSDTGCGPGTGLNVPLVANNMGLKIIKGAINGSLNDKWEDVCVQRQTHYGQRIRRAMRGGHEGLLESNEICCMYGQNAGLLYAESVSYMLNDNYQTDDDFVHVAYEQDLEDRVMIRSNFRQTWLFDIVVVNQSTTAYAVTLPHSITTSLSAMSLSADIGFCIQSMPIILRSFQDIFLDISMPPSVVQNEHLEAIVSVFNYSPKRVSVTVYTYRVNGICSEAETNEDRPKRQIQVDSNSLKTVSYPMVAIRSGVFEVKFVAVWSGGGADVVVKNFDVRPPDPQNRQQKMKGRVNTGRIENAIFPMISSQMTVIDITPDPTRTIVPGTQQCIITGEQLMNGELVSMMDNMTLVCTIITNSGVNRKLLFNNTNCIIKQSMILDTTDVSHLIAMTTGTGMARLSVTMKYNVFESTVEPLCRFDLSVSADEWTAQSVTATEDLDYLDVWTGGQWVTKSTVRIADTNNDTLKRINNLSPEPIETTDTHRSKLVLLVKLCVQHMPAINAGLNVTDVGIFTGFTPNGHDLREIVSMNHSLVTAYEISDRNILFYMQNVSFIRVHHVTNTPAAFVRIYEYNNLGDSCIRLFTPVGRKTHGIDTVCDNSTQLCDCVQRSNCPSAKRLLEMGLIAEMRVERARQLFDKMVCSPRFTRVFTATISGRNVTESGLKLLSVRVKHLFRDTKDLY
ncbi:unnamed protein product [Medioppia subpectinata]|uniref:Alpha-2-macroglobulin domain-containing protein n=1 Tax=Medioppia subpectinata TaxID=1979941 RepID=A0A7R9KM10_9ACAR|nr:unnamed protein product [Medioppia subpectinata]CAG2106081.1 unnamed protein product [Medioppia subpectinata]